MKAPARTLVHWVELAMIGDATQRPGPWVCPQGGQLGQQHGHVHANLLLMGTAFFLLHSREHPRQTSSFSLVIKLMDTFLDCKKRKERLIRVVFKISNSIPD